MATYSRSGTEITINTATLGEQFQPSIAGFAGGGFVVVWTTTDATQDGSGRAIKFQRYDAAGVAIGGEVLVDSATALDQRLASVTVLSSGNFLVSWETTDTAQDGAGTAIKAQLFSGAGVAIGSEFRVNTRGTADQINSNVTALSDGGFVVAWQTTDSTQDGLGHAIKAQRYDAGGTAVGAEFLVNPIGTNAESKPNVIGLANGGFLATWTLGSGTSADIYAQLFDAGGAKTGAAFRVNSLTALNQDFVTATQLADGRIVVAWASSQSLTYAYDVDIKAQVFSASGIPIGGEFMVNTTKTDPTFGYVGSTKPQIDDLPDGGFVITWTHSSGMAITSSIRGQFYDASAQRVGSEVVVNTATDRFEGDADVAVDGNGRMFAVWASANSSVADYNIRGQFFVAEPSAVVIQSNGGGDTAATNVAENSTAVTTVSATGAPGIVYAIAGGADAAQFTINASTGALAFAAAPNYEVRNDSDHNGLYQVIVSATAGALSDLQTLTVTVTNVNEGPGFPGSTASYTYIENGTAAVATVAAVDPDGDTLAYSLTGLDAAKFTITATGQLAFAASPDFEAAADAGGNHVYDVTVIASDGSLVTSRALTVELLNWNEGPVITSNGGGASAAITVAENSQAVTTITLFDPEGLLSWGYSYSLSGADAALFGIQAQTGYLYFGNSPNFEAPADANGDGVYEVTVSVSDGFEPADTQALSITVGNVNETPVITSNGGGASAAIALAENTTAVTIVAASDPEGGVSYAIAGGADAASFAIDASTGALSFVSAPDFEAPADADANNVYQVVIRASDGGLTDTQALSVSVTDAADAPLAFAATAFEIDENSSAPAWLELTGGAGVGPIHYSITGGADEQLFRVDALTGELNLEPGDFEAPLDQDGDNVYQVEITAEQGADTVTGLVTVTLRDVNEAPVFLPEDGFLAVTLAENSLEVAALSAFDPEGQALSFAILDVYDGVSFSIDAQTGVLSFVIAPDFEAPWDFSGNNVYVLAVAVSDGENVTAGTIEVHVTDVAEILTFAETAFTSLENELAVATLGTSGDPATTTYAITGGADAALFTLDTATGALGFLAAPDFEMPADAEGDNVYEVIVEASDGELSAAQALSITVLDENEAPWIGTVAWSTAENETYIGRLPGIDPDGDEIGYFLTGIPDYFVHWGADWHLFTVDPLTGDFRFIAAPDFEHPTDANGDNVYELLLGSTDGVWTTVNFGRVTVLDQNDAPAIISDGGAASAALALAEGQAAVTTIVATDAEAGSTVGYAITGGADAALFAIDAASGALSFVAAPDFETPGDADSDNVYDVVVSASDGSLSDSQAIAVTVGNVNEAVSLTSGTAFAVAETGLAVTTVTASDLDGAAPAFSIVGGADAALFAIDAATGALSFVAAPNFEAPSDADGDNLYDVVVSASDGSLSDTLALAITVGNVNEAPVITSNGGGLAAAVAVNENTTAVTTMTASDPEGGVTYLITGGADASRFTIDAATGALRFIAAPNFEAPSDAGRNNVYEVVVRAFDGTFDDPQVLSVAVGNVNEAPVITSGSGMTAASYVVTENNAVVATIAATDPEGPVTYTLGGGADAARFTINAAGLLSFLVAPDYDAPGDANGDNLYEVVVLASDGSLVDTQALTISVGNVIDGLTINGSSSANTINGSYEEDAINGLGGNDTLNGLGAADRLDGGDGQDRLIGGAGADVLTGGLKADDFVFTALSDSTLAASDRIMDFSHAQNDDIDLSALDANALLGGNQAFSFIGSAAFSHSAGQLRAFQQSGDTFVQADVNGDGVADFQLVLDTAMTLVSGDFIL
jgi:hypothetical protein